MSRPPKAFFFDFDGVIVDTETPWVEAVTAFCSEYAVPISTRALLDCLGDGDVRMLEYLAGRCGRTREEILQVLRRDFMRRTDGLQLRAGVARYLDYAWEEGYRLAMISNSTRAYIDRWLKKLSLEGVFDCIITRDCGGRMKPHPDLYQKALNRLGLRGEEVIAIEDSTIGLAAARAAGLWEVAFPNDATRQTEAGRHFRAIDLGRIPPGELVARFLRAQISNQTQKGS